jgi:hypothetical protein
MEATSAQGVAITVFLVAFVFLALSFFGDGGVLSFLLFIVGLAASIALFLKAKPAPSAQS